MCFTKKVSKKSLWGNLDLYRVRKNYRNSVSFFDKIQAKLDFYLLGWAISCVFMLKQHVLMVDNVIKHVQADQDKYFQYSFKFQIDWRISFRFEF